MPPAQTADSGTHSDYRKTAGEEPLPGYTLLAPLGRGGFGEVWKCEAPGGLHKAVKFVTTEGEDGRGEERYAQEFAAFELIKTIRHPFLLTLERVERVGNDLVMVMELADRQLADRFRECRNCGLPGIPRDELLAYFADAAEALDMMATKYSLQHLDIKPANLFIVSGHVKVGDYGLVSNLEQSGGTSRGLTPRYVAPEVLHGSASNCSDQYSLALVYYELLTGEFPYPGKTPQQLMLQHVSGTPDFTSLPSSDHAAVARALSKRPDDRFPSCLAFVQALMAAGAHTALPNAGMTVRRARVDRSVAGLNLGSGSAHDPASDSQRNNSTATPGPARSLEATQNFTIPGPSHTLPGTAKPALPPLVTTPAPRSKAGAPPSGPADILITPAPRAFAPQRLSPPDEAEPLASEEIESGMVVIDRIRSVIRAEKLIGQSSRGSALDSQTFSDAVLLAAASGGHIPKLPGDLGRRADGAWVCQFPTTVPASLVPLKLAAVGETWGVALEQVAPTQLVLRRTISGGSRVFGGKKLGYEVVVALPGGNAAVGEVSVESRILGASDPRFAREILDAIPKLIGDVRNALGNVQDRRKHPRVVCDLPVRFYPLHSDGSVDAPVAGRCRDVSAGGVAFVGPGKLPTKYHYVVFEGVPAVTDQAALVRVMWTKSLPNGTWVAGCQYRTDL